ncbi:hypothetical protein [Niabella hibiscisoli]|nr:hypothetical protein [Niabella hibiscisoli]
MDNKNLKEEELKRIKKQTSMQMRQLSLILKPWVKQTHRKI